MSQLERELELREEIDFWERVEETDRKFGYPEGKKLKQLKDDLRDLRNEDQYGMPRY